MEANIRLAAVVVYYHPDKQAIENTRAINEHLDVIVVDNSETPSPWLDNLPSEVQVINNGANHGIAKALNQGIERSIEQGANWCFLFDQDSTIPQDFVGRMLSCSGVFDPKTAAVVPLYYAENLKKYGDVIQVLKHKINRISAKDIKPDSAIWASYAITSGSLINSENYQQIGKHDENLFIDFVDIEWGLRANHLGYKIFTNSNVALTQQLGEQPIQMGKVNLVNHSPLRHFYYFRNAIYMLRLKHVPLVWKCYELMKFPLRFALYSLFTRNRCQHIQAMSTGIWHGITRQYGMKKGKRFS